MTAGSAALAWPLANVSVGVGSLTSEQLELENLTPEQKNIFTITNLQQRYKIPAFEDASALYKAMGNERAAYYAGGAVTGSLFRAANNAVQPESRRNLWHRTVNIFGGGGAASGLSYPVKSAVDSPLTSPDALMATYKMPRPEAEAFAENHARILSRGAAAGAITFSAIQEIFIDPPKKDAAAPDQSV